MATLISQYSGSGKCRGRCDARCHDAKGPVCRCICGGRFHGKGYAQARQELTDEVHGELLAEAGKAGARLAVTEEKLVPPWEKA